MTPKDSRLAMRKPPLCDRILALHSARSRLARLRRSIALGGHSMPSHPMISNLKKINASLRWGIAQRVRRTQPIAIDYLLVCLMSHFLLRNLFIPSMMPSLIKGGVGHILGAVPKDFVAIRVSRNFELNN